MQNVAPISHHWKVFASVIVPTGVGESTQKSISDSFSDDSLCQSLEAVMESDRTGFWLRILLKFKCWRKKKLFAYIVDLCLKKIKYEMKFFKCFIKDDVVLN